MEFLLKFSRNFLIYENLSELSSGKNMPKISPNIRRVIPPRFSSYDFQCTCLTILTEDAKHSHVPQPLSHP